MENDTVAIIGPQHSVMAHVISHIANELQVPLLSFAATDPTLNSLQFPYFVRTTQSDLFQMAAVADIVNYYVWRDVIAIYIDDDHGRNGVVALEDKLAENRCKISYKAPLNPKLSSGDITNQLVKVALMESRVIILHIYATWGLEVLDAAWDMGMMRSGYVWIATDWLSTVLDTESSLPSAAMDRIQGVLTLRMHTPDSELKRKFVSRWSNLTTAKSDNGLFGLNSYGLYAYDTVMLLAQALDAFLNQRENISFSNDQSLSEFRGGNLHFDNMSIFDEGNHLLISILQVNITGVTGQIKFNSNGNLMHPAYEVINVVGKDEDNRLLVQFFPFICCASRKTQHSNPSDHLYGVYGLDRQLKSLVGGYSQATEGNCELEYQTLSVSVNLSSESVTQTSFMGIALIFSLLQLKYYLMHCLISLFHSEMDIAIQ
ncbi:hypothetical protein I3760_07G001400 [Carya illinoinensis]|nr:hypothetical protein I3760_07G001400 [Carya illinoinensis]